jgi:hypothetical protein
MHFHSHRMRRLVASGLLPERAGQSVKVWAHRSLAELHEMDDGSVLQTEWITEMQVRWAAHRAVASQADGDGAAWLDGTSARAVACDAAIIPVVTGQIDPAALEDLVDLCLQFAGHGSHCAAASNPDRSGQASDRPGAASPADGPDPAGEPGQGEDRCEGDDPRPPGPRPPTAQAAEMLRHAIIGKAVDLVSGPGGLASFLRTRLLGARLAGPPLPLDVGRSAEIPAAIRRAVILRDQHCR